MGLKETLKKQEPLTEQENSSEVVELKVLIQEQSEKIQKLSSTNFELQASNQTLRSELMTASERIESLTSRASSVNKTELENKSLLNEAQKSKATSDKALKEAEQAKQQAKSYYESAERAKRERQAEAIEKSKAKDETRSAQANSLANKMKYRSLLIGNMIFTLVLAFFVAYDKRGVFSEMGRWFPARWHEITGFLKGIGSLFKTLASFPPAKWHIGAVWGYLFAIVLFLAVGVGVFFFCCWLKEKISNFWWNLMMEYTDETFMAVISADIVLAMLYVCLFFHEGLKKLIPLNILSIWLILSFVGVIAWNGKHIVKAVIK